MATYRLVDSLLDLKIDAPALIAAGSVHRLYSALEAWKAQVPIQQLKVILIVDVPPYYDMQVTRLDGGKWKQKFCCGAPLDPDPYVTYDVPDQWRRSQAKMITAVNDAVIALVGAHLVTELKVDFQ